MPETLNAREEQQMLDAVKKASDLVTSGLSPDEAVEKVARDYGFGPGRVRLMGQGYNTGQQLGQWRTKGTSILDKLAGFELCDPEKVISNMRIGSAEKAAADRVDSSYSRPPAQPAAETYAAREKTAAPLAKSTEDLRTPDPYKAVVKAYGNIGRTKLAADEARRQATAAKDQVMLKVAHLVTYFKKAAYNRVPFETAEAAARTYHGESGAALMGMVYARAGLKEKRAGAVLPVFKSPIDPRVEPFSLVKAAIDAAATAAELGRLVAPTKASYTAAKNEELRPFLPAGAAKAAADPGPWDAKAAAIFATEKTAFGFGTEVAAIAAGDILAHRATHKPEDTDPYGDANDIEQELAAVRRQSQQAIGMRQKPVVKKAFLGAGFGAAVGGSIGRTMGNVTKTKDDLVNADWMGLEDPEHENELRKIRAHALINGLMTDPDDPISSHDPDKVLAAYNEISAAAPRVAENAATLRPALRKRLEGHVEPFESKELLDIEHGLARTKMPTPNTNILGETPEKLLG